MGSQQSILSWFLYVAHLLSQAAFEISLSLVLGNLIMMCLNVVFFIFILLSLHWASKSGGLIFLIKFWIVFLFPDTTTAYLRILDIIPVSLLFIHFSFCVLVRIVCTVVFYGSLIMLADSEMVSNDPTACSLCPCINFWSCLWAGLSGFFLMNKWFDRSAGRHFWGEAIKDWLLPCHHPLALIYLEANCHLGSVPMERPTW